MSEYEPSEYEPLITPETKNFKLTKLIKRDLMFT